MRRLLLVSIFLAAPIPAAAMDGVELLRLCERDARPCAGIIRDHLKGWPKRVLDPKQLKQGRMEYATCPPHQDDTALAELFVRNAARNGGRIRGLAMKEAIEAVFTEAFPACASSQDS